MKVYILNVTDNLNTNLFVYENSALANKGMREKVEQEVLNAGGLANQGLTIILEENHAVVENECTGFNTTYSICSFDVISQ